MAPRKLIGILGGMGPAATIDFMSKICAATDAQSDQDHVPLLVHDVPQIPDRSTAIESGCDTPFLPMLAGIRMLDRSGVDFVAMPCNTAHFWYERLARACGTPIIHIADAVRDMLDPNDNETIKLALMATRGTIGAGIYQKRLAASVGALLVPDDDIQVSIDRAIAAVKAGAHEIARSLADKAGDALLARGATHLLLACTELPIAIDAGRFGATSIDATDALAKACVAASMGSHDQSVIPRQYGGR